MKKEQEYKKPHIATILDAIAEKFSLDPVQVKSFALEAFPELRDKKRCANCGESMAIYTYTISVLDAQLLCEIAKVVTKRMQEKGMSFTEANKVHLQSEIKNYTLASRQTIASKLGLVAKVRNKQQGHDRKAGWCITKRGYEFLAGKPVPKQVKVFHNEILGHFDEMITMTELFRGSAHLGNDWQEIAGVFVEEYQKPRLL